MFPKAFRYILPFIYGGSLPVIQDSLLIIHAYAIADRLMMNHCKNLLIDRLRAYYCCNSFVPQHDLELIDELGYDESRTIARYIKEQFVYEHTAGGQRDDFPGTLKDLLHTGLRFTCEVAHATVAKLIGYIADAEGHRDMNDCWSDPPEGFGCHYHQHDEGETCYTSES